MVDRKFFPLSATLDRNKIMKAPLVLLTALFIASAHQTLSGETSGDWTYSVSDNQATITGYSGVGGALDIPAVVNDAISVVKVGNSYPSIFGAGDPTVTSITIPDSVTSIGTYTFYNCTNLTSITIPDSVTSIGTYSFLNCTSLTTITVDADNLNYSSVGGLLFNKLQTLLIQYPVGILGDSYTIPDSVTSIGTYSFYNCPNLTNVTIGNSVTSIGGNAFQSCSNLATITIADSVTSIGGSAFQDCIGLTNVTIPDSVTSIAASAFLNCTSLTSVTLPATLFIEGNYSDYSLLAEQVRVEKTSIDAFVVNAETAARTAGKADVTSDPATYSLYTAGSVSTAEAASRTLGRGDVTSAPATYSLYTASDVTNAETASRTLGQADVTDSPASYGLFTAGNVSTARTLGRQDVTGDPATYSLYTASDVTSAEATSRSAGQADVTASPSAYDLYTSTELAEAASGARTIVNVSARVTLGSGQMVTPGFVVRDVPTKLLIRAVGPRLGDFGVNYLPNPRMKIFDGSQNVVRTIDDWKSDNSVSELSDLMTATASAGAFPLEQDTASAATLVTLDPGVYTVQVDSADEGVGDVLVEVYEISE